MISDIVRALFPRLPIGDNQPTPSVWRDELAVTGSEMVEARFRITPGRVVRNTSHTLAAFWMRTFTVFLWGGSLPFRLESREAGSPQEA